MSPDSEGFSSAGWNDEDMRRTVQRNYGLGSDSSLPNHVRFLVGVARVIRNRVQRADAGLLAIPAVFFLQPSGPCGLETLEHEVVPMLDNGLTQVEGRLIFVGPVAARAIMIDVENWSDAEVFGPTVQHLGLAGVPAVLFETRTDPVEARFYTKGLDEPDTFDLLRLSQSAITMDEVFEIVDRVHLNSLVVPTVQSPDAKLWQHLAKKRVSKHAERRIQWPLRVGLSAAFPMCVIREEQSQATGRIDLEIEESDPVDPSQVVRHALLELKVIRSFWESGEAVSDKQNANHIAEGVVQAAMYRDERNTRAAALCCFDMRSDLGQDCFSHVRTKAKRTRVVLRRWHIFASAKEYREALDAGTV